jgi:hypothetical protein
VARLRQKNRRNDGEKAGKPDASALSVPNFRAINIPVPFDLAKTAETLALQLESTKGCRHQASPARAGIHCEDTQ